MVDFFYFYYKDKKNVRTGKDNDMPENKSNLETAACPKLQTNNK